LSYVVWKLVRRMPRPMLLVLIIFVLTSLARA
jgi:hypothetical protein